MKVLLIFFTFLLSFDCLADSEAMPYSYIELVGRKNKFFHMVPEKFHFDGREKIIEQEAYGIAYQIEQDGSFQRLWSVHGWYSFSVYLTSDAVHMVRMGKWHRGHSPKPRDIAFEFYENGKLLKQYFVLDLLQDPESVRPSVSHYRWLDRRNGEYPKLEFPFFEIKTVEGNILTFNVQNGEKIVRIVP